jgi:hypothetical protein
MEQTVDWINVQNEKYSTFYQKTLLSDVCLPILPLEFENCLVTVDEYGAYVAVYNSDKNYLTVYNGTGKQLSQRLWKSAQCPEIEI